MKSPMILDYPGQAAVRLAESDFSAIERKPDEAPIRNSAVRATYDGKELMPFTGRVGAMDAFSLPSRGIDGLTYRKGVV